MKKHFFSKAKPMTFFQQFTKYFLAIQFVVAYSLVLVAQTESEPNNSFDNATAINFNQVTKGALLTVGDKDYFKVEITSPGVFIAQLKNIPQGKNYTVSIFNQNKQILSEDTGNANDPAYTDKLRCSVGTHYVLVDGYRSSDNGPDQYELTVFFNSTDVNECNNSFEEATPIQFNTPVLGTIFDTGDKDYFKIEVPSSGVLSAQLKDIPNNRDYSLKLYNTNQQEIGSDVGNSNSPAYTDRLRCSGGTHYILIEGYRSNDASTSEYELVVYFDDTDKNECNNSFEDATEIQFDSPISGTIFDTGDKDYFKIEVPSSGVLSAQLKDIPNNRDYSLILYNTNQQQIRSDVGNSTNPAYTDRLRCSAGTHYILVEGYRSNDISREKYELTVSFNNEDIYECNNSSADATLINPCVGAKGNILPANDIDVYKINISSAGTHEVFVRDVSSALAIDIEILDEFGERIKRCTSAPQGNSARCEFTVNSSGEYFVSITAGSNQASVDLYTLTFSDGIPCQAIPEICNNGLDDDNDGLIDCADSDCANFEACKETEPCNCPAGVAPVCGADGKMYASICLAECAGVEVVPCTNPTEICNNNVDDDNDGLVDCEDPDCSGAEICMDNMNPCDACPTVISPVCGADGKMYNNACLAACAEVEIVPCSEDQEICDNGIDDDNDGFIDEADSDCMPIDGANITFGEVSGSVGDSVKVPVYLAGCANLFSLQWSTTIADNTVARLISIEDGLIKGTLFNPANGAISYTTVPNAPPIKADQPLFYLVCELVGVVGNSTTITALENPLAIQIACVENGASSIQPHSINLGTIDIVNTVNISGNIVDWKNQQGINQTMVQCIYEDGTFQETMSDKTGFFQFDIPNGSTVELKPTKNTDLTNGVSSFGMGILREFIIANNPVEITSPYQIIAGNYDCWTTESVDLLDIINFRKLLIGLNTEMAACESWTFLPSDTQLPTNFGLSNVFEAFDYPTVIKFENVTTNQTIEFTGVKMGDILGDANLTNGLQTNATERQRRQPLSLNIPALAVPKQSIIEIPFTSKQFKQIFSFQTGLSYNQQQLELMEIIPTANTDFASILWNNLPTKGHLKLSWISPQQEGSSLEQNQPIFKLKFKTKTTIKTSDWEQLIRLEERILPTEIVDKDRDFKIVSLNVMTKSTLNNAIELYGSFPNPTATQATIPFYLPQSMEGSLIIRNHLGQTVETIRAVYPKGYNEISFKVNDFTTGLYFYTLRTATQQLTKSMVIIKQ